MRTERGENPVIEPRPEALAGPRMPPARRLIRRISLSALGWAAWGLGQLGKVQVARQAAVRRAERVMRRRLKSTAKNYGLPPRVSEEIFSLGLAAVRTIDGLLARGRLRSSVIRKTAGVLLHGVVTGGPDHYPQSSFVARNGVEPPGLLLLRPTNACNLRCVGCYANSAGTSDVLDWPVLDRMVGEAKDVWGSHFMVLTGGEPLVYRSRGRGVLDLAEKHQDMIFMMYTNGMLIDDGLARRIGRAGNLTPAVSIEGLKARTDRRRGAGTFDAIRAAMDRLRREKVLFGVSLTATRDNTEEILSDEAVEFFFGEMGAAYAWVFHHMPIGRAPSLGLLPTPDQRQYLYERSWQLVKERHIFVADFWNGGTISKGCLAGGRPGGFLAVNGRGQVSPCVFMPYSPININEVFAVGGTLENAWAHPFFHRIRSWQAGYGYGLDRVGDGRSGRIRGNWLMPCPIRDHHLEFASWLKEFRLEPLDANARAAMEDPGYRRGMAAYNEEVAARMDPIWDAGYMDRPVRKAPPPVPVEPAIDRGTRPSSANESQGVEVRP